MINSEFVDALEHHHYFTKQLVNEANNEDQYAVNLRIIDMLNTALATELMCVLRYRSHAIAAKNLGENIVAAEFDEHAAEEQEHADMLAKRISQLNGTPHMSPRHIQQNSDSNFSETGSIDKMIQENYTAEKIAIQNYQAMIVYIDNKDPTTRRMLEDILAVEEEHADDLSDFANKFSINLANPINH